MDARMIREEGFSLLPGFNYRQHRKAVFRLQRMTQQLLGQNALDPGLRLLHGKDAGSPGFADPGQQRLQRLKGDGLQVFQQPEHKAYPFRRTSRACPYKTFAEFAGGLRRNRHS